MISTKLPESCSVHARLKHFHTDSNKVLSRLHPPLPHPLSRQLCKYLHFVYSGKRRLSSHTQDVYIRTCSYSMMMGTCTHMHSLHTNSHSTHTQTYNTLMHTTSIHTHPHTHTQNTLMHTAPIHTHPHTHTHNTLMHTTSIHTHPHTHTHNTLMHTTPFHTHPPTLYTPPTHMHHSSYKHLFGNDVSSNFHIHR